MYPQSKNIHPRIAAKPTLTEASALVADTSDAEIIPPASSLVPPPLNIYKGYDRFYLTDHRWHKSTVYKEKESGRIFRYMRCANHLNYDVQCQGTGVKFEDESTVTMRKPHAYYCSFNIDEARQRTALADESACSSDDAYRTFENVRSKMGQEGIEEPRIRYVIKVRPLMKGICHGNIKSHYRHPEWAHALPFVKLKSTIRRCIRKNCPCMPKHLVDLAAVLHSETWEKRLQYTTNRKGSENLHAPAARFQIKVTNVTDKDNFCHVIFHCPDFLKKVFELDVTDGAADATYQTLPLLMGCYQLLIFMVIAFGKCTPIFFVIMSRKTEVSYVEVFRIIRKLAPTMNLEKMTLDFEVALKKGLKANFPEIAEYLGGLFHHVYNLDKWTATHGLKKYFKEHPSVDTFYRKVKNLPLLPAIDIERSFEYLVQRLESEEPVPLLNDRSKTITLMELLQGFIHYYRKTWIQQVTPNDYSVYMEDKRTNNELERNNRTWHEIAGNHPRLIVFLDALVKMMQKVHMDYNERREVGVIRRRPSSEEEVRRKFLLTGWATIHGLGESVSVRHRQQVLMEFLENSVNITSDFHMRVEFLTNGVEPPPREPGLEETCAVIRRKEWSERLIAMRDTLLKCPICFREYEVERFFTKHLLDKHKLKQCNRCQDYYKGDASVTHSCLQVRIFLPESIFKDEVFADEELSNGKCSMCSKTFESGFQLELHTLETHNVSFVDEVSPLPYDRSVSSDLVALDHSYCATVEPDLQLAGSDQEEVPSTSAHSYSLSDRMRDMQDKLQHLKRKGKIPSDAGEFSPVRGKARKPLATRNTEPMTVTGGGRVMKNNELGCTTSKENDPPRNNTH